jgi:hypothetical protein
VPLRILIDEDLSPTLAQGLWDLGYDATSVRDRGRLGLKDWELLPWLVQECLTICTGNGQEWAARMQDWQASGKDHFGLLVVDQRWGTDGILRALQQYLETNAPETLLNQVVFVDPLEEA